MEEDGVAWREYWEDRRQKQIAKRRKLEQERMGWTAVWINIVRTTENARAAVRDMNPGARERAR